MVASILRHFDKLSDRSWLAAEPAEACQLTKTYFLTENAQMMASLKVSPGQSTVVG